MRFRNVVVAWKGRRSDFGYEYEAKRVVMMQQQQHRAATLSTKYRQQQKQRAAQYEEEAKLVFRLSSFGRTTPSIAIRARLDRSLRNRQRSHPSPPYGDPTNQFTPPPHNHDHDTHTSYPSPPSFPPRSLSLSISRTREQRCRSSSRSPTRHSGTTGAQSTSTPWIRTPRRTSTAPRCTHLSRRFQSQRLGRLGSRLGSCCEAAMRRVR